MGNAPSAAQGAVFAGFDGLAPRDQRDVFSQLLAAADEARSTRRPAAVVATASNARHSPPRPSQLREQRSTVSVKERATAGELASSTTAGPPADPPSTNAHDSDAHDAAPVDVEFDVMAPDLEPATTQANLGFARRPPVPPELREAARKLLRGDLSDDVLRLVDRTVIRLFVSSTDSAIVFMVVSVYGGFCWSSVFFNPCISIPEFDAIASNLKLKNRAAEVTNLLESTPGSDPESHAEAIKAWEDTKSRIGSLLKVGGEALEQSSASQRYGASLTEREVLLAQSLRTGTGPENFYGFQRTLLDIKRKAPENAALSSHYIDMIDGQIDRDAVQEIAKLRSRVRANRFYAVPWRLEVGGLAPNSDKVHGQYITSFCDDAARILAESILRHYSGRAFTREWNPLAAEIVRHALAVRQLTEVFRGRESILQQIRAFLDTPSEQVLVVYGPSGVGKSSLLAKAAEHVSKNHSTSTLVYRFVGTTPDSSDSRGILRSVCAQLARTRGFTELKERVASVIEAAASSVAAELAAATGEPGVEALLGDLESWPPTSYEGLQAAFPVALGMATETKPIVLIIDGLDEITDTDDARDLTWLPDTLPPNVKIILSTAPPRSKKLPTLSILKTIYPDIAAEDTDDAAPNTRAQYFELPAFSDDDVALLLNHLQLLDRRTLTAHQRQQFLAKAIASRMPLYVHTAWRLIASKWSSSDTAITGGRRLDNETVPGLLEDVLDNVEAKLGSAFVSKALGYLTAARQGLSHAELCDVLSCDEDVLTEVFRGFDPPIRRVPPVLVVRLFEELQGCLVERQFYGVNAFFWSHSQFKHVAEDRYLYRDRSIAIHTALADYWEGKWAKMPKPYYDRAGKGQKNARRYIMDQPLLICGKPNTRRLASLVWHQLEAGVTGFQEAARTLQDIGHLAACVDAGLLSDLLASYRSALAKESAETLLLPQLVDYYRFLLGSADVLSENPQQLIPLAANLYQGSAVANDARRWITVNAGSAYNWLEWQNRPLARGEPIATLRGSDGPGGTPLDSLMVTGRDTHGERVVAVGVRTFDGRPGAVLFDTAEIRASGSGGGTARLLARMVVSFASSGSGEEEDEAEQEEEVALTCAFSRRGDLIAVAGRDLLVVGGFDFSRKGVGKDPELPAGDAITAIAWTKGDGCIVTASDGEEPGRLVLWDADSFALLRVIRTQYPRQPIASSYATLGFWDEYRSLFILLDVDELAEDAESGLSLQYIPCKSHTDPPPDSKARFALAHRAPHVLIASDDGKGYILIDFKSKKPIARMTMEVDNVLQVALSHDGRKVAVVPNENNVIFVLAMQGPDLSAQAGPKARENLLGTFRHVGTVLGVDPGSAQDANSASCVFSRSGNTILTDGDFGSIRVWDMNELGDHSTLRFKTQLFSLPQALVAVASSTALHPVGWAVTEGTVTVSLTDAKGRSRVRSHRIDGGGRTSKLPSAFRRDIILGIATHPARPLMAVVTDLGNLSLVSVDRLPDEPATWVGSLLTSAFGRGFRDDEKVLNFNVRRAGAQAGPTCVAFLPGSWSSKVDSPTLPGSNLSSSPQPNAPQSQAAKLDLIAFATGHEDGSICIWEWFPGADPLDLSPRVTLSLNAGRVTSLVPCKTGEKTVAFTIDDTAVVVWDGTSDDPESAMVLIPPKDFVKEEEDYNRRSVLSVRSSVASFPGSRPRSVETINSVATGTGAPSQKVWNEDRPCAVAFAHTRSQLLATGGMRDGMITIWNTEAKVKRNLLTPASQDPKPIPAIMAISWSSDDATIVSVVEDKQVCVHNTVTGHLVWVHDLWMIRPRLNIAAFGTAGRHLSVVDHDGELTVIQLHGDWPTAATAMAAMTPSSASPSAASAQSPGSAAGSAMTSMSLLVAPRRPRFPPPPDPEYVTITEWDPSVSVRVVRRRTEKGTRSSRTWQRSTGSGLHGHVALLELAEDLPRGTYEVLCEVSIPEEKTPPPAAAGTDGDADAAATGDSG
ncbi:NACHT domain- and WD repeat-containing protein 1, partial [Cladochytrium tenue]